jgi:formiminoglutamate deiminase
VHAEFAWLPDGLARDVRIGIGGERFVAVQAAVPAEPGDRVESGVAFPGFADTHSHAFHRALRGRTHDGAGTFWTWRERMYAVTDRLHPDSYLAIARAAFAELALAGVSSVGEFHYLHHGPGGRPYADPNAMGAALLTAARDAGVRLTLLDACYLAGGLAPSGPTPVTGVQLRFADADVDAWAQRVAALPRPEHARIGAAIHSVRAVPRDDLGAVVAAARGGPLHVHLSEQPAENEQCLAAYGVTPAALLAEAGALGTATTAVHATHLTDDDIALLGTSGTAVSLCPTTEADLGDGVGPARALRDAGTPLCLGGDQHVVSDLLAEAQALERHERLGTGQRVRFAPAELVDALCAAGQRSLGWDDAGRIAPGARADLTVVRLDSPRTAGADPAQVVLAAGAADVSTVFVDGQLVVDGGVHRLGDVGALLADAIGPLYA